jgi:hypothetical protein
VHHVNESDEASDMGEVEIMSSEEALRRALVAIRQKVPQSEWDSFADSVVHDRQDLEKHLRADPPANNFRSLLGILKASSYARLPIGFEPVREALAYLDRFPVYKGPHPHIFPDSGPMSIEAATAEFPICCYRWQDVVRAPGLMDQLNDPRLIDFIEAYLGCVPTLYAVNAFWSFPAEQPQLYYQQHFHRDTDDWRFLALFIYLTDVDDESGPHQVVPGSATLDGTLALAGGSAWNPFNAARKFARQSFTNSMGEEFSALCDRFVAHKAANVVGPAGSMFLVNTLALHRGLMPTKKSRLVLWARYGLDPPASLPPPIPVADKQTGLAPFHFPATPRNRYINRLLFDFDQL